MEESKDKKVSLEDLMVSTLAMTDALAKLMIAKGIIRRRSSKHSSAPSGVTTEANRGGYCTRSELRMPFVRADSRLM